MDQYTYALALVNLIALTASGQSISFLESENFAFKVKQIDEFIDRFNQIESAPIREYIRKHYEGDSIGRIPLLLSLFDQEDTTWNEALVREFVTDVAQTRVDPIINFYDYGWYAELDCIGQYQGREEAFTIVLSLEILPQGFGSSWRIRGASADFLNGSLSPSIEVGYDTTITNFSEALRDTANFRRYLGVPVLRSRLLQFLDELSTGRLAFRQIERITYHFLQVDNWIFTVRDFNRDTPNSGWLISKLHKVNDLQKLQYLEKTLYLN